MTLTQSCCGYVMDISYIIFISLILFGIIFQCFSSFVMDTANYFSVPYLKNIIYNVAEAYKLTSWQFLQKKFEVIAQNYFGVVIPVDLFGITKDGQRKEISLVLKLAPTDVNYRVSGALTEMFGREIYVYTTILAETNKLQARFRPDCRHVVPHCYYVCGEFLKEVLVLQDMCADGYQPYTRDLFLDLNHITVSIQALAKFHALSLNLKADNFSMFEEAATICLPLTQSNNPRFMQILLDRLQKALDKFTGTQYEPFLEYYKNNHIRIVESTYSSVIQSCICHGDMWKENILFKYEGGKPVAACLIDYQTARLCSPAYDLLYLIITSTSAETRRDHYFELLHVYYSTFSDTLKQANLFAEEIYMKQQLQQDLKSVAPGCLIVANTALWLACGLQEEGHVRSKVHLKTVQEKQQALERYKNIIKCIFDDLLSYGYLEPPINSLPMNAMLETSTPK